jgi:hypothetical protein
VVLLSRTVGGLAQLYGAFLRFCVNNHLTINAAKTKAMVARAVEGARYLTLHGDTFEIVPHFTYLGTLVDPAANESTALLHALGKARGGFTQLCEWVGSQKWTTPWTRLLLHDVFVRTHMTFGAPVWAPRYLRAAAAAPRDGPLGVLAAQYRRGLRVMAGAPLELRVELLYVATLRWPLEVVLLKAAWRYFNRVQELIAREPATPIAVAAKWARNQGGTELGIAHGLALLDQIEEVGAIYKRWRANI